MKITAGLGSVDDYLPYVEAGADEFFCGYVPYEWMQNGGLTYPLNRREVLYYNVQIGSESEMEILAALVRRKKKIVISLKIFNHYLHTIMIYLKTQHT